jgi:D-alanine-D-alanine ligase
VLGSSICMDKDVARRLLAAAGIPVVPSLSVSQEEIQSDVTAVADRAEKKFGYPYFAKPANMGSSVGVHKIKSRAEAAGKLQDAAKYDLKILIEHGVDAIELECSVLGNEKPTASIIGEIVPKHDFYSYEAKYMDENGAEYFIPSKSVDAAMTEKIQKLSIEAFKVLECKGMARVDFFLDRKTGELFLNELNTIPGFTSISMYPKLWEASGLPYPKLLDELIRLAIDLHQKKSKLKTTYEPQG